MSRPMKLDRDDAARCDARVVYVAYCTVHGYTEVGADGKPDCHLHAVDAEEAAADHNHVPDCTCFDRDTEFTGRCAKHGAA